MKETRPGKRYTQSGHNAARYTLIGKESNVNEGKEGNVNEASEMRQQVT